MKTQYIKYTTALCLGAMLSFSSCLKDDSHYLDPAATQQYVAELTLSGLNPDNYSTDAVTDAGPTITRQMDINIASINAPTTATTVTVGVDNSIVATYDAANPAINYLVMPAGSYTFPDQTVTIPAGSRQATVSVTFNKALLDPSQSYMLPIKIKSASVLISGNYSIHYLHFIGNDFAGAYTWDYRRWQNGVGPVPYVVPSQSPTGGSPDIQTLNQAGTISPVSPTEFMMLTGYNSTGVLYDVTFTRTVSGGVAQYSNWAVTFPQAQLDKWAAAGITNIVAPKFTIPPPSNATQPKIIEINYVSGGASGRYIDDTYHH
jgi:hypothetical protein